MIGIVIVSHSEKLAEGVIDLARMMAKEVKMIPAGGLENGEYGTSFDRINAAIDEVASPEGVLILMDMGSAVMTTEMVLDMRDDSFPVRMADCPLVEGAVSAACDAECGMSIEDIIEDLALVGEVKKLS
ncbi:MAG: PTS-dependent dihydroxyacetone kinase phosphotransferase subunit DhaM [Bacteroidaceae bacterium]|nr:PTS-dependent dihydroxyacetone kinase phosphotransferase subunit DhaM [Bacteroidaceae bacterium]